MNVTVIRIVNIENETKWKSFRSHFHWDLILYVLFSYSLCHRRGNILTLTWSEKKLDIIHTWIEMNPVKTHAHTHLTVNARGVAFLTRCVSSQRVKSQYQTLSKWNTDTHTQRYIYLSCIGSVLGVENHWIKFTVENFIKLIKPFSMHIAHIHSKWHDRIRYVWIEICTQNIIHLTFIE